MDLKFKHPVYYVGVQTGQDKDYHLTLVTHIENYPHHIWEAKNSEKPLAFTSKKRAEELAFCIQLNGTFACVVMCGNKLTGQPFVKHEE